MLFKRLGRGVNSSPIIFWLTIISTLPFIGMHPVENETQIKSLAGITSVQVIVNIGLSKEGPTRKSLQEEVERELREGGIQVLQYVEGKEKPSMPIFHVEVAIWRNAENSYVYFVNAHLFQPVHLIRDEQMITQAVTWQSKTIGAGTLVHINKDVAKVSKNFVVNVQRANQEKPTLQ